jgi:hypothetical protein
VARTARNAAARRHLLAAMLAIVALAAVVVSSCLTSGARQVPHPTAFPQAGHHGAAEHVGNAERADGPGQVAATAQPATKHQCPDPGPPAPACHNQADLQLTTPAAGPRPDADLLWDHPRYAAERAGLPGSPFADPAPDLIALSISRT